MQIPAPLYRDPVHDGATDPTLIWNREEKAWYMFYTQRRAIGVAIGVSWVHGTDLGIASSPDGIHWLYRGCAVLEPVEPGRNTFWAPEILFHAGMYHMFVSYITGVPTSWTGDRHILHYVSGDLWHWSYRSAAELSSNRVIDAGIFPLPQGGFRMWYKDEDRDSHIYVSDSPDLEKWHDAREAVGDCSMEGPNVFALGNCYFMICDQWQGLGVYHSDDLEHWTRQEGQILARGGSRPLDGTFGHHADVVVQQNRGYIYYFTHPLEDHPGQTPGRRRSVIQAAVLTADHQRLSVERDRVDFQLQPET